MKKVEIPINEFEELIKRYKECDKQRQEMQKIINYLNKQIEEYNKKFVSEEKNGNMGSWGIFKNIVAYFKNN